MITLYPFSPLILSLSNGFRYVCKILTVIFHLYSKIGSLSQNNNFKKNNNNKCFKIIINAYLGDYCFKFLNIAKTIFDDYSFTLKN